VRCDAFFFSLRSFDRVRDPGYTIAYVRIGRADSAASIVTLIHGYHEQSYCSIELLAYSLRRYRVFRPGTDEVRRNSGGGHNTLVSKWPDAAVGTSMNAFYGGLILIQMHRRL